MKLSPANIKRQEFSKVMRGYDVSEVAAFLERVADEIEELQTQNEELKKDLEFANSKVTEFRRIEKNLQETLIKAQETSAKSMEAAKKQAVLILKDAEGKAQQIIEKARINSIEIRNAVDSLKEEKDVLLAKLKAIVNSQINIISKTFNEEEEPVELEQKRKPVQSSVDIDINDIINKISE
jgi:cell division initiation protein